MNNLNIFRHKPVAEIASVSTQECQCDDQENRLLLRHKRSGWTTGLANIFERTGVRKDWMAVDGVAAQVPGHALAATGATSN